MARILPFKLGTVPPVRRSIPAVDGELLMERVWAAGHEVIEIDWEKAGIVRHGVEDEVIYLCDAYNELLALNGTEGSQFAHLADGVLQMTVQFSAGVCHIEQCYTPYLHPPLRQNSSYCMGFEEYVSAWEQIICGIQELAEAPRLELPDR